MATNDPFRDFRRRRGSLFDEFFSDFFDRPFGADQGTGPSAVRPGTPAQTARRRVEQVDITDFFSDATRELLQRAAQRALEWGSLDLDSEHLLWAAMQDDLVAQIVRHADGDPAAIAAQVEDEAERGGRTDVAPSLSPEAKAASVRAVAHCAPRRRHPRCDPDRGGRPPRDPDEDTGRVQPRPD